MTDDTGKDGADEEVHKKETKENNNLSAEKANQPAPSKTAGSGGSQPGSEGSETGRTISSGRSPTE